MAKRLPPLRKILFLAIGGLFVVIGFTLYKFEFERIMRSRRALAEQEALLAATKQTVQDYRERVDFYKTSEGIEHLAHEQYNLVRPGERVILLDDK